MIPLYQKLFLLLALFLPFSFALSPTKTIDLNILKLFIPIIFLFWLANSLLHRKIIIDNRPRFWFLITFLFIVFLSFFWTSAPESALRKILFFTTTIPLYFIVYTNNPNQNFQNKLLKYLVLGSFISACLALAFSSLQFIIGLNPTLIFLRTYISPFFLGHSMATLVNQYSSWLVNISGKTILRTFSTFPDPHLFSLYLSMTLPLTIYLYKKRSQKKYLYFFTIILLTILLSFSRAAYLAIIIGGIFLLITSISKNFFKKRLLLLYSIFILILFLFITPNPLISRFQSSFNLQDGSNSGRIEMWKTAIKNIQEKPLFGLGLGGFADNLNSSLGFRNPIYAHNLLLDFAAETGIFNAIILLAILLSPILFYFKELSSNKQLSIKTSPNLSQFIATSFIIFFVHSLFETPFFSIRVFPLFLILLAINSSHAKMGYPTKWQE